MLHLIAVEFTYLFMSYIGVFSFCLISIILSKAQLKGVLKSKDRNSTAGKTTVNNGTQCPGLFTVPERRRYPLWHRECQQQQAEGEALRKVYQETEDPDTAEAGRAVAPLASALTHRVVPFPCRGQIPTALT